MEGRGAGMGGMPAGAPQINLDAGAQEYYPAVVGGAAYPPFLTLQPQQLYCPPPYPVMPPMPMPPPVPIPQQIGPAAAAAVDGPASRAVVLSLVPRHAQEADVARAMAAFGAVRAVDASAVASGGVATAHFFDLRAAELAVAAVRAQHMRQQCRLGQLYAATAAAWPPPAWDWPHDDILGLVLGQAVWAQFAAACTLPDDGFSRGSLVVLNSLPDDVSLLELRQAFQAFGDLKDLRQSQHRPSHKFVEFFDTRDAARALAELNGQDFFGHRLVLEFTRPSTPGSRRRGYVPQQQPMAPVPPRLQQAWRPTFPQPSSSSSGSSKTREGGVVLVRRTSSAKSSGAGDRSKGGNNNGAGTSHERKGKGGKKATIVVVASSSAPPSTTAAPTTASSSGKQQQCVKSVGRAGSGRSHRSWKGRFDKQFEFREPEAADADTDTQEPETRTTVMIRNIPNKYSQKLVLNMLDAHCIVHNKQIEAGEGECQGQQQQPLSSYDFLYLPIDFKNKCNVGYGFVNLTSPEAAVRLHKAFHHQPWEVFNSRKICQVTYARVQGLEALKQHFKNCSFPCETEEYLPVVFSPPRDGLQLTEPVPLVQPSLRAPSVNVDPLALELMAAPSSSTSGDGASSTMSTHADEGHGASCSNDDDDEGLAEELQRLGYTD